MRLGTVLAYWFFPLLAVLFTPDWPDFERARRFLLMVLAGCLALLALRRRQRIAVPADLVPFALLVVWCLLSAFIPLWRGGNLAQAFLRAGYLVGLLLVGLSFRSVREHREREDLLMGIALATLLTSAYGLAQALGWEWPAGYTVPHELVSTLGNRNVASEWTVIGSLLALGLALGSSGPQRFVGRCAFLAGTAYLWTLGGRGALLGWIAGLTFLLHRHFASLFALAGLTPAMWVGPLMFLLAGGGAAAGFGLWHRPEPPAAPAATQPADPAPGADTLGVRVHIWQASLELGLANRLWPLIGVGSAQWVVQFPAFRHPAEIAVSSAGHATVTEVDTAHNDPIEILLETGVVGLFLLGTFWWRLLRQARTASGGLDASLPAASAAFLVASLSRAPLFNAPAAAALLATLPLRQETEATTDRMLPAAATPVLRVLAVLVALAGAVGLASECAASGYVRLRRTSPKQWAELEKTLTPGATDQARERFAREVEEGKQAAMDHAIAWLPFEDSFRVQRADYWLKNLDQLPQDQAPRRAQLLTRAAADADAVLARAPHRVLAHWARLRAAILQGDLPRARMHAGHLLRLDPEHPGFREAHWKVHLAEPVVATRDLDWLRQHGHPDAFLDAATAALQDKDLALARTYLGAHTSRAPGDPRGYQALAETYRELEPLLFREWSAEAHFAEALAAVREGRLGEAAKALGARKELVGDDVRHYLLAALLAERLGNAAARDGAVTLARRPGPIKDAEIARFLDLADAVRALLR